MKIVDFLRGGHPIHDWHLQVHYDKVYVPFAALFAQICLVLLHALKAIVARFNIDVEQLFYQNLCRYYVVANVINDQATILTVALNRMI